MLWVSFARKDTPHQAPIRNCAWRFEVGKVRVLQLVSYKTGGGTRDAAACAIASGVSGTECETEAGGRTCSRRGSIQNLEFCGAPWKCMFFLSYFVSIACDSYRGVLAAWAVMFVLIYTHTNASGLLSQHYCCALLFYRLLSGYCLSL